MCSGREFCTDSVYLEFGLEIQSPRYVPPENRRGSPNPPNARSFLRLELLLFFAELAE